MCWWRMPTRDGPSTKLSGWLQAVRDVDVYLEQPCPSYEECLAVRRHTNRPFILDEVIDDVSMVLRGAADGAMDIINLKISKVGGLTKARQIRDLCVSLGIALTIEDTWGGESLPPPSLTWRTALRRNCCFRPRISTVTSP